MLNVSRYQKSSRKTIGLLLVSLAFICNARAQVHIDYTDYHIGKINTEAVAYIKVRNYTGVEIHYYYKGWITDEGGRELLRVKSELLKHRPGGADFREEQKGGWNQLNVKPFDKLEVIHAAADLEDYTGMLTFHAELIHPLDTHSIIARQTKVVYLKDGYFVNEAGGFVTDPKLVRLQLDLQRNTPFSIEEICTRLELDNKNAHTHCDVITITLQQQGEDIYELQTKNLCIPPGKQSLKPSDFEEIKNSYAARNLEQDIRLLVWWNGQPESHRISAVSHAGYDDSQQTYTSNALGLSFDYFKYAQIMPVNPGLETVVIFNERQEVEEVARNTLSHSLYPLPLDYPKGFYLRREDVNGSATSFVYDWSSMDEAEWTAYFAYQHNCASDDIVKTSVQDLQIWYPRRLNNIRSSHAGTLSFNSFYVAIKDGDRFIWFGTSMAVLDEDFSNFPASAFRADLRQLFSTLNYHGLQFDMKLNTAGELETITTGNTQMLTDSTFRAAIFRKYGLYAKLLGTSTPMSFGQAEVMNTPDLATLDASIIQDNSILPVAPIQVQKISPDHDPVRRYASYNWEAADLSWTHRTTPEEIVDPFVYKAVMIYHLNEDGEVIKRQSSNSGSGIKAEPNSNTIQIEPDVLVLATVPGQTIHISTLAANVLDEQEVMTLIAYEEYNGVGASPDIAKTEVNGWTFYTHSRLLNKGNRMPVSNFVMVKTSKRLYRIQIIGGFESDIHRFLNSLVIEGRQLRISYDSEKRFEKIECY